MQDIQHKNDRVPLTFLAAIAAICIAGLIVLAGCSSMERGMKTMTSDMGGGLNRTVILYSNTGEEIQRWEGKVDLQVSTEGGHIVFDKDGKRTVISGGILVAEER